jgi:tetratricopeptide (TPR) repeat protein
MLSHLFLWLIASFPASQSTASTDPAALVLEAQQDETAGQLEAARDLYERALLLRPRNPAAQAGMASASERLSLQQLADRDQDAALATLIRAQQAEPDNQRILYDLGILEDQMKLYLDSAATLEHLVALKPAEPGAYYALGRTDLDLGQLELAEKAFETYLQARPQDASAHFGLGKIYAQGLQFDKAEKEFQQSLRIQPKQVETYYELGQLSLQQDRYEAAMANFTKALERDPHHGGALVGLGTACFKTKQYDLAKKWLQKAIAVAPDYQPGHYYLGLTLARLGDSADSRQELDLAATLAERDNEQAASRLRLQSPGGAP